MSKALVLLALVGLLAGAAWSGYRAGWAAAEDAAATAVAQKRRAASTVSAHVERQVEAAVARTEANRKVIHDLVPVYVPAAADAACLVPVGAVELLDAAAEDRPPVAPAVPAETPSGVALHQVVDLEADNLATCNEWRAQLVGWQAWYRDTRAAFGLPAAADSASSPGAHPRSDDVSPEAQANDLTARPRVGAG